MHSKEPILSVPFDLGVNTLQPHISLRPGVRIKCLIVSLCEWRFPWDYKADGLRTVNHLQPLCT